MCYAEATPCLGPADLEVQVTLASIHAGFGADGAGITTCLTYVAAQPFKSLVHLFVWRDEEANRVHGCQSTVFMHARKKPGTADVLEFLADSDADIVRGELGLLQRLFNGQRAAAVLAFDVDGFMRRMHFAIEFPFPDAVYRYRIWRKHLPAVAPLKTSCSSPLPQRSSPSKQKYSRPRQERRGSGVIHGLQARKFWIRPTRARGSWT